MVNTAITLTKELMKTKYDLVINMGVAGSFSNELNNGDVVEVVEDNFCEIGFVRCADARVFLTLIRFFPICILFLQHGNYQACKLRELCINL